MDSDEKLTALKKAYAEIILNTSKEAAARIMVLEWKASRLEHELKHAKEDGVNMLLRLKQMMDLKTREAALVSSSQQKKIDELEAQLQEAEDIVKDLREDLRAVEAQLEKFSQRKEVKHMVQANNVPIPEPVTLPPSEVQHNSNKSQKVYKSLLPIKKSFIGDLPSIILRSKETELYRNGCTQRVRARECIPPSNNIKSTFSVEKHDLNGLKKPESVSKEGEVQVKEMDAASDENLVRACNGQSTSGQEKGEVNLSKVCKTSEVPSQPSTDRVIKYTFQMKRKRGAMIDESGSSEQSHENLAVHEGPVNVNLIGESTPEKIRLEQVAHQLISLSDKKWW
ncbi:uncharacterized protein LOC143586776 isoform X2 [Bidens hawaiensis]|uniref:uncharacterized protein LOC143586776 isoform X2 n=1 Tax=Bidens hawaiensis TaxID=980011 RepID=UPI00404AFB5C